jgi:hypothetical protein
MKMMQKNITAIYCDDIRNELGAKLSFIGVYSGEMYFPSFPIVLAKFCIFVTLKIPKIEYPKEKIKIRVCEGANEIARLEYDKQELEKYKPLNIKDDHFNDSEINLDDQNTIFSVGFTISPFSLKATTYLKVTANIDDEEIEANALKIRLAADDKERQFFSSKNNNP